MRVKQNHFPRVNELTSKIIRQDNSVQVFSAAGRVVAPCPPPEEILDHVELFLQRQIQTQPVYDLLVAGRNLADIVADILPL